MLCQHWRAPTWDDVSEFTRPATTLRTGFLTMLAGKQRCSAAHNRMIKDAIANIARDHKVQHFLSCIAHFLGHLSGLATIRSSGFPPRNAPNSIRRPWGVSSYKSGQISRTRLLVRVAGSPSWPTRSEVAGNSRLFSGQPRCPSRSNLSQLGQFTRGD
jgi:hypothetical protein